MALLFGFLLDWDSKSVVAISNNLALKVNYYCFYEQNLINLILTSRFARLLRENQSKLAAKITEEQGKTLADAEGDVLRGIRKSHIII